MNLQISSDKAILTKMNRGGGTMLPDFKIYLEAVLIKSADIKTTHTDQWHRVDWLKGSLHHDSKHSVQLTTE